MLYDYRKLNGRITEICGSQTAFAAKMGWSEHTTSFKLNSKTYWKQPEISKAIDILGIPDGQIQSYFFKLKVQ